METNFSELPYEQIIEMSNNQSYNDIISISMLLQESLRHYFSRMLMDTSEESPLECNLLIDTAESQGVCDLQKPHIIGMYQEATEGLIYLQFEGDEEHWYALDDITIDEQLEIAKAIEINRY